MIKKIVYLVPRFIGTMAFIATLILFNLSAPYIWGGEYPERPIMLVVPYAPGSSDLEARILAPAMGKILNQPVVVETRPGGGGSIGTNYVVRSKPDGYMIMFAGGTVLSLVPNLSDVPFKLDDLIPIASTSYVSQMFAVNPGAPWKTMNEFVDYAKKNPDTIKFGSAGTGTAVHMCGEAMAFAAGIKWRHVPFKGAGEAVAAAIGGHVDCVVVMPQSLIPQVKGGKLRALSIFSSQRHPELPEIPPITETGIPFDLRAGTNWWGFFAPKGTPEPICDKLAETVRKIIKNDLETLSNIKKIGSLSQFLDQNEFKTILEKQSLMYKETIDKMGLKGK